MKKLIVFLIVTLFIAGCSSKTMIVTNQTLPQVYVDVNSTSQIKQDIKISLFQLDNYTDTPRAGQRATNIVEGVLLAKGYNVTAHIENKNYTLAQIKLNAKQDHSKYYLIGGVSEWRYKTGIDGEPAVSMQLSLYKTQNSSLVWSATAADSDWGTGSIGTTAQELIENMTAK
ncbi:hypothetical protein [Sulfurimonas sp.]